MSIMSSTLVAALLLAGVYLLGDAYVPWEKKHPRRWISMAAGASMAYIFLDVLPELGVRHEEFIAHSGSVSFAEHRIYVLALVGFVVLYALDELVETSGRKKGGRPGEEPETATPIFWIQIGGFALYGGVIGDALVGRGEQGAMKLWLYVAAMAFHVLVITSSLANQHGKPYHSRGRWVLAASMLAGWFIAAYVPLPEVTMARLFAIVAGGVLMTSANEELAREKGGRFGWFVIGAGLYGTLLLMT